MSPIQFMLIAAFGSAMQEVIHLYDLRTTLHMPDTSAILKHWQYWAITLTMIIVSGVGTWLLYGDSLTIKSVIVILGAAFPLIFKKLVATAGNNPPPPKGIAPSRSFTIRDYFR